MMVYAVFALTLRISWAFGVWFLTLMVRWWRLIPGAGFHSNYAD
jgi:hypothetical protein